MQLLVSETVCKTNLKNKNKCPELAACSGGDRVVMEMDKCPELAACSGGDRVVITMGHLTTPNTPLPHNLIFAFSNNLS